MTFVFYADVTPLMNDTIFEAHMKNVPDFRREKIRRLKFRRDKCLSLGAWIVCDCALREQGLSLSQAGFEYAAGGKPFLKNLPGVHIGISHSESIALCAVSDSPVGADVEFVSDFKEGICKRFFNKKEQDYVLKCENPELKRERFFRMWVLKESYVKFTGNGIGEFCDFEIDVSANEISVMNKKGMNQCYFSEPDIPRYKVAVCTAEMEKATLKRVNIIKDLLEL